MSESAITTLIHGYLVEYDKKYKQIFPAHISIELAKLITELLDKEKS